MIGTGAHLTIEEAMKLWDSEVRAQAWRAIATERMRDLFEALHAAAFRDGEDAMWAQCGRPELNKEEK